MKVTVRQYYTGFASLWALAAAPFVPPLLHFFIPDSNALAMYLYPPLGDVGGIAVAATIGFLLASTVVIFAFCASGRKIHRWVFAILAAFGVCALIGLHVQYVRRVPVPSADIEVPVSVGYQRSEFAIKRYPQLSDVEMLQRTGPTEDLIQKLWTRPSISRVRILLWLSYTLTVTCFLCVVSTIAYQHAVEEVQNKLKHGPPENAPG